MISQLYLFLVSVKKFSIIGTYGKWVDMSSYVVIRKTLISTFSHNYHYSINTRLFHQWTASLTTAQLKTCEVCAVSCQWDVVTALPTYIRKSSPGSSSHTLVPGPKWLKLPDRPPSCCCAGCMTLAVLSLCSEELPIWSGGSGSTPLTTGGR